MIHLYSKKLGPVIILAFHLQPGHRSTMGVYIKCGYRPIISNCLFLATLSEPDEVGGTLAATLAATFR